MGAWCVPDGPFLILPVMGPSTPRAATGFVADGYASPMWWIAHESGDDNAELIYYGVSGLKYLNLMAENLPLLESLEEGSVDYYEAIKTTYLQNRSKIKSCQVKAQEETPDYDFDMDMEED
jgi:phospholipid-binding lipoprotein MlaA